MNPILNHNQCPDKHTPHTPGKDGARRWGLAAHKDKDLLTVSPGSFGALQWMSWTGLIWMTDICKACVKNGDKLRKKYRELKIQKPLSLDIREAVHLLVSKGRKPVIDIDLAFTLPNAIPILRDVLFTLRDYDVHTKVLLTYVNHRDGLGGEPNRRQRLLESVLPQGIQLAGIHNYSSSWSDEHHNSSKGSAMAVADIRT
jgi:hypothetical protein